MPSSIVVVSLQVKMMFYDNLHFVKELPSPEGAWELVEVIGEVVNGSLWSTEVFRVPKMLS